MSTRTVIKNLELQTRPFWGSGGAEHVFFRRRRRIQTYSFDSEFKTLNFICNSVLRHPITSPVEKRLYNTKVSKSKQLRVSWNLFQSDETIFNIIITKK